MNSNQNALTDETWRTLPSPSENIEKVSKVPKGSEVQRRGNLIDLSSTDPKFLQSDTDCSIDSDLIEVSVNTTEDLEVEVDETDDMDLEEAHCKADIYAPLSLNLKML